MQNTESAVILKKIIKKTQKEIVGKIHMLVTRVLKRGSLFWVHTCTCFLQLEMDHQRGSAWICMLKALRGLLSFNSNIIWL